MIQYIDKDALIAEIERLITELVKEGENTMFEQGRISALEDIKVFITNTLEIKGADKEKETGYPFKPGDKVIIHCSAKNRYKTRSELFNDKVGTVQYIWNLERNPWGNIGVVIDGGYSDMFYVEELEPVSKEG